MGLKAGTDQLTCRSTLVSGGLMIALVILLFFVRGFATVLVNSLTPQLKSLFELSNTGAMLGQFSFFLGYFVFSLPSAFVVARVGYVRAIVLGLIVMMVGCMIFASAARAGFYTGFLAAFFFVAAGVALTQVASNPLVAVIGPPQSAASRMTLAQAFHSFGTVVGPLAGASMVIGATQMPSLPALGPVGNVHAGMIQFPSVIIVSILAIVALMFWLNRDYSVPNTDGAHTNAAVGCRLLSNRRFLFGVISIFTYVGAEVAIGSIMINYLMQGTVLSVTVVHAGRLVSLYWGGAMVGRFFGAAILRVIRPAVALSICAGAAMLLALVSLSTTGPLAAVAIIAIGIFNSIMFPTIFAMAIEGLGDSTPRGAGILCTAIVGGAVVPLITGVVADMRGLAFSLAVPAACYLWVTIYGIYMDSHIANEDVVAA